MTSRPKVKVPLTAQFALENVQPASSPTPSPSATAQPALGPSPEPPAVVPTPSRTPSQPAVVTSHSQPQRSQGDGRVQRNGEAVPPKRSRWHKKHLSPKDPVAAASDVLNELDAQVARLGLKDEIERQEVNFKNAAEGIKDLWQGDDLFNSMVITGAGSIGKTRLVEDTIAECMSSLKLKMNVVWFKHHNTSTGKMVTDLYKYRGKGNLLVLDDMDRTFDDFEKVELLNGALENDKTRQIYVEPPDKFPFIKPNPFLFEAKIIIITNDSLTTMIRLKPRLGPHLAALASRMFYHDLEVYTQTQKLANVYRFITRGRLLEEFSLSSAQVVDVVRFLADNKDRISIGLRQVKRIACLRKNRPDAWQSRALSSHSVPDTPSWEDRKAF